MMMFWMIRQQQLALYSCRRAAPYRGWRSCLSGCCHLFAPDMISYVKKRVTFKNQPQRLFPGWRHHALWKDESVFFSPQSGHLPTKDSTTVLSGLISEHSIKTSPSKKVRSGCQLAIFISFFPTWQYFFLPGYIFSHMAIFFFPIWQYFFPHGNMFFPPGYIFSHLAICSARFAAAGRIVQVRLGQRVGRNLEIE